MSRGARRRSREQRRVIELASVDEHVCVGVACHLQRALSDEGADLCPRPPLTMEEADPPMAEARVDHDSGTAAARQAFADARTNCIRAARGEQACLRVAVLAGRHRPLNRLRQDVREVGPPREHAESETAARRRMRPLGLVVIADCGR